MSDDVAENDTVTASDAVTGVVDDRSEPERQRDEYLDALQRLQADFENYRKRVARSSMDAADRAAGEVVVKMLPVLDAFDLAAQHFSSARIA
jgi:molecular chaperone GrpE